MATWIPTANDRGADGKIKTQFAAILDESMEATGVTPPPAETQPAARPPARQSWPAIAAVAGGLALAVTLILLLQSAPVTPMRAQPTAQPTARPTVAPSALPAFGAPLDVALVAYFDPADPETATALEDGRRVLPVARIGQEWLQLELEDGARVWVRWRDLPAPGADLAALPDLAPPPTATAPPLPTAAPIVVAPPPTMEPEICISTDYGRRCGPASAMADEQQVVTEIATESKAHSEAWLATATAEARP